MKTGGTKNGPHRKPTLALITRALNKAVREAVELHRQAGQPLVVWKDGQVALIPPPPLKANRVKAKSPRRKS